MKTYLKLLKIPVLKLLETPVLKLLKMAVLTLIKPSALFMVLLSSFLLSIANAEERLTVQPDRTTIALNETFTLTVKYENGTSDKSPNFTALESDFTVLNKNQSSQYQNNNGTVTRYIQWTLTLAPKQAGKVLVPPLSTGQAMSRPLTLLVTPPKAQAAGTQVVMLETHIDTQEAYVQQEFVVALKLLFRENIIDIDAEPFVVQGAALEELPRAQYRTTLGNLTYDVLELRFAITPQTSGLLEVPSFLWNLRSSSAPANRFGNPGRTTLHRLRTEGFTVTVKPRPANFPAAKPWLPAKSLTLTDNWSDEATQLVVGEPVTRTVIATVRGLSGEQLPPIAQSFTSDDFNFYPEQPQINSDTDDQGKLGSRTESMAVIPTRAGQLTLPAIEVFWWDTQTDTLQTATLPAKTFTVKPAATKPQQSLTAVLPTTELEPQNQAPKSIRAEPAKPGNPAAENLNHSWRYWPWVCALLVALNMAQLIVFLAFKSRWATANNNQKAAQQARSIHNLSLKPAIKAAKNNDAQACHKALTRWYQAQKIASGSNSGCLNEFLKTHGADEALLHALKQLDNQLFGRLSNTQETPAWQAGELPHCLAAFEQQYTQASVNTTPKQTKPQSPLASLYPVGI